MSVRNTASAVATWRYRQELGSSVIAMSDRNSVAVLLQNGNSRQEVCSKSAAVRSRNGAARQSANGAELKYFMYNILAVDSAVRR
jgi:hypothetical protein